MSLLSYNNSIHQDSYCYVHADGPDGFDLWGVFDGHGESTVLNV